MFKVIKKADIILTIALILLGLFVTLIFVKGSTATTVEVSTHGQPYGSYSLLEDREIHIGSENTLTIKDGSVYMSQATCNNKDCIHQGKKSLAGENIVCLPNKVLVEVKGEEDEYDSIAK